jgi:hypothetical protein
VKNTKAESEVVGRRRTLQLLGLGLAAGGLFVLDACSKPSGGGGGAGGSASGTPGTTGATPGDCTASIDDNSKNQRRLLQYRSPAADPAKHCSACAQYVDGQYGDCGGGCKLIPGPVKPTAGCLSFAPKGADAGAAPHA